MSLWYGMEWPGIHHTQVIEVGNGEVFQRINQHDLKAPVVNAHVPRGPRQLWTASASVRQCVKDGVCMS